jgi:ABC-type Fe3+/spermidine/putrescine transport system ATPase subunit
MTNFLTVSQLSKSFGDESVLDGVSFSLSGAETLSILGRSGSGKTTLLKILAGLESADAGRIMLRGEDIGNWKPQRRGIVYLYQEPLLLPHLNLFDNMAFGLRLRKMAQKEVRENVHALIGELGLTGHEQKMPQQLSGGQRQRVAFGRAIVVKPSLLLLDEPFGSLDVEVRANMQELFKKTAHEHGLPALFVTHDLKEAILMGDRIGHMEGGKLRTFATKHDFIEDPDLGVQREIAFWDALRSSPDEPN